MGQLKDARHDLAEELCRVVIVKGKLPSNQNVQHNARRPHVHFGAVIALDGTRNDLWCHVIGRPTLRMTPILVLQLQRAEPKVRNFQAPVLVQKQVLRLHDTDQSSKRAGSVRKKKTATDINVRAG